MRRFLFFVVLLPLGLAAVALSVANREIVTVSLDPMGLFGRGWQVSLPMYALLFGTLMVGVVIGGIAAWLGQSKWRYAARLERANIVVHVLSIFTDFSENYPKNPGVWVGLAVHVILIGAFGYCLVHWRQITRRT